jgi:hypothetical protein
VAIVLNSRIVANTRLAGLHGGRLAGGYALRLSVEFDVLNWDEADPPQVMMAPARVNLQGQTGFPLGFAFPENIHPFNVTKYSSKGACLFDLFLSQQGLEAVERHRNGQGISMTVTLHAQIRRAGEVHAVHDEVRCELNVGQWIQALEQAAYGRSLLFEVPIPVEDQELGVALEALDSARRLLSQGHYGDAVAKCRIVIEEVTSKLGQDAALAAALQTTPKHTRTLEQREFVMRQAAMDFASLAHHSTGVFLNELFDRNSAQLVLATTAALVSSALARRASGQRRA